MARLGIFISCCNAANFSLSVECNNPHGYEGIWELFVGCLSSFHLLPALLVRQPWQDWKVIGKKPITKAFSSDSPSSLFSGSICQNNADNVEQQDMLGLMGNSAAFLLIFMRTHVKPDSSMQNLAQQPLGMMDFGVVCRPSSTNVSICFSVLGSLCGCDVPWFTSGWLAFLCWLGCL
ncbi:hypothetical protein GOP47_0027138 [Adiantum capillus-veneris]|nr:hypothetical protein GOP47_0027138 [Adiantum capillus-veneris]